MEFTRRAEGAPRKLGILAGTFHPPTRAHVALAHAGLGVVEEVLFVLPRAFPHKSYEGPSLAERLTILEAVLRDEPRCSLAVTEGGLFIDIARECRAAYTPAPELYFLCGRDAAERILHWDYGRAGAILEQLREFQLLVARREGEFQPPPELRDRIHPLPMEEDWVSATDVRHRIRAGQPWEHLVPEASIPLVRQFYGPGG